MRKPTMKGLKRKAWKVFSLWVRKRGAENGYNNCVTCGVKKLIKELDAGHYYHGKNWMSSMDERNVWPQCTVCNQHLHGNLIPYSKFLIDKYGIEIIDILGELRHQGWKPSRTELEDIIKRYS